MVEAGLQRNSGCECSRCISLVKPGVDRHAPALSGRRSCQGVWVQARDTAVCFNLTCFLYPSAGTAVTEGHRRDSSHDRHLFSHDFGGEAQNQDPVRWVSGETLLQAFLLCPHMAVPVHELRCIEREREMIPLLKRPQSYGIRAPPLRPHLTFAASLEIPSPHPVTLGLGPHQVD